MKVIVTLEGWNDNVGKSWAAPTSEELFQKHFADIEGIKLEYGSLSYEAEIPTLTVLPREGDRILTRFPEGSCLVTWMLFDIHDNVLDITVKPE